MESFLSDQGIDVQGNSDVFVLDQESLGIDVIRDEVIRFVSSQKVSNARVVILSFDRATTESQNALLKSGLMLDINLDICYNAGRFVVKHPGRERPGQALLGFEKPKKGKV